ncbi:phosphoserine phosphatase SerB [Breoghania sp. L-A4]|uniref:phosphoserine phosphatase SerB n=1 Tax=Breoghania sp. L-A4 TaxID=2304600 RepID=UPI000E35B9D5|nr:phosphoserine phosphatase SerB [Breoghania sp. L-A4]AXS41300.1 phosphoserine phosphatase SerB [Breoghania sp. L-A4]
MTHVVTLVSSPAKPAVDAALAARLRGLLPNAGTPRVLADEIAADVPFSPTAADDLPAIEDRLRDSLNDAPVDLYVQPEAGRRKRLLIADMDSTMIGQECIDELAAELGLKERIAAITERAMRGEIEFEPALRERVGLLKGLDIGVVDRVIASRITLTPGGRTLVRTMQSNGGYCALVSGGFTVFTGPIGARIGFDEHRANTLLTEDGMLSGTVGEPILGREAKRQRLHDLVRERGIAIAETLAVGDGANDLAMIGDAGLGVAYHAKPAVAAKADARIDHGDLTALLYLQGYGAGDFVTD